MAGLDLSGSFAPLAATTKTITAGGAITVDQVRHIVAANSGVTDDLDTITVDSTIASGYGGILILQADAGDTITVKDGTGNITTGNNADIVLTGDARLVLEYDATNSDWKPISLIAQVDSFTVTNWTSDTTLDCDASSADINADVIGTILKVLIASGLLGGTVSA